MSGAGPAVAVTACLAAVGLLGAVGASPIPWRSVLSAATTSS